MLAIVDSQFPWMLSGFRYWENYEFYNIDRGILFFSFHKMNDYFPAEVRPVGAIEKYPVTDIYCVFLYLTLGLLGYKGGIPGVAPYWVRRLAGDYHGLPRLIRDRGIRLHTTIYPGGGYHENLLEKALAGLEFIRSHPNVTNVFTNLALVQEVIPGAHYVPGICNVEFYRYVPRAKSDKIQLVFAAHRRREKGFAYLAQALNMVDPAKYHLHIVGDWKDELHLIRRRESYTYYGTLPPRQLREVYYRCHVIVTPGFFDNHARFATVDGFPPQVGIDAMSTGCCLVSTNLRKDHRVLIPGVDYFEINEKSADDIANVIEYLYENQDEMLSVAARGAAKIVQFFDMKKNVALKYKLIKGTR